MTAPLTLTDPAQQALERIAAIARSALGRDIDRRALWGLLPSPSASPLDNELAWQSPALRAKTIYAARRKRDRAFGEHACLLADPAWDIMLDLFVAHHEQRAVSVSSACIAACVAPTTALRWINSLERRRLIERVPDLDDRRRHFLTLSVEGLRLVEAALA